MLFTVGSRASTRSTHGYGLSPLTGLGSGDVIDLVEPVPGGDLVGFG
jgi:hypothetical protein